MNLKLFSIQFLLIFTTCAFADDGEKFPVATNQTSSVKQKLAAYENGKISLYDLTDNHQNCDEFINYYLSHGNDMSLKAKLPVSRCYAMEGNYLEAIRIAQEYVNVYSNDWYAWRILGASYTMIDSPDKSIAAYKNAVRLGDKDSYESLATAAAKFGRFDVIVEIVPQLIMLKNSKQISEEDRNDLTSILLYCSINTTNKDIFIKTLEEADMKKILKNRTVKLDITFGCQLFKGKDIDKIRNHLTTILGNDWTNQVPVKPDNSN